MRILHTSDWHLGQRFIGESREAEHRDFLEWLLKELKSKPFDVLIIAGDIFDTTAPPSYARELYSNFFAKIADLDSLTTIVIGGNHDSPSVLNEQKSILKKLNIYVIGGFENPKDSTVPIYSKDGELKGVVSGVPFLRESDFRDTLSSSDESSRGKELENSIKNHYQEMFMEAKKVANSKVPLVATGHLTVLNTQMFESMRELYIGSLKTFNIELFPEFDYIALGHFHKIKRVKNVCYSGSPIPLSFDEANGDKYLLDVEVLPDRDLKIREVVVPKFRELLNFSGDFETIKEKIKSFKVNSKNLPAWAKIDIKKSQDNITFSEAIKELKSLNRDIKILKSSIVDSNLNIGLNRLEESAIKLQKMTPKSVFEKRLTLEKEISNKKKDELMSAFLKIVEELESEDFRG